MCIIEDADSLPSTDDHIGAQGPHKSEQLGYDAGGALLRAQLGGVDLNKLDGLLVVDMRVKTGDLLNGVSRRSLELRRQ